MLPAALTASFLPRYQVMLPLLPSWYLSAFCLSNQVSTYPPSLCYLPHACCGRVGSGVTSVLLFGSLASIIFVEIHPTFPTSSPVPQTQPSSYAISLQVLDVQKLLSPSKGAKLDL